MSRNIGKVSNRQICFLTTEEEKESIDRCTKKLRFRSISDLIRRSLYEFLAGKGLLKKPGLFSVYDDPEE